MARLPLLLAAAAASLALAGCGEDLSNLPGAEEILPSERDAACAVVNALDLEVPGTEAGREQLRELADQLGRAVDLAGGEGEVATELREAVRALRDGTRAEAEAAIDDLEQVCA